LAKFSLTCPIIETMVRDQETAVKIGFLRSPTVRINGVDIEPSARSRTDFGIMCRRYEGGGVPPESLIRRAIAEAVSASV
jgi:hypothetical protein